jgi:hypothetical protein
MSPTDGSAYRDPAPPSQPPRWNPRARRALAFAALPFAAVPLAVVAGSSIMTAGGYETYARLGGFLVIVGGSGAALITAARGIAQGVAVRGEVAEHPTPARGRALGTAAIPLGLVGIVFSLLGMMSACLATMSFSRGRQLRRRGRVLLAPVARTAHWTTQSLAPAVDATERAGLAAQWRENGRTEHASVAAFARLTLDLMALGAPATLLAAAQRDAADEVRHTELCFSLAEALDGRAESPGGFPDAARARTLSSVRTLALAQLAVDSLVDGALNEGVSARVVATLAKRCDDEATRAVLKEIAADEGRHAAHGWDVVAWCLTEGGAPVAHALRGALAGLPATMRTPLPAAASDGSWERWGIHGHALEADAYAKTLADVRERVLRTQP